MADSKSVARMLLDTARSSESNWVLTTYETIRDYQLHVGDKVRLLSTRNIEGDIFYRFYSSIVGLKLYRKIFDLNQGVGFCHRVPQITCPEVSDPAHPLKHY